MSDRTGTVCPECGPECWDLSPEAFNRATDYEHGAKRKATREGVATPAVPQHELDRQDRELDRRRTAALAVVRKVLDDKYLTAGCQSDWKWYEKRIPEADAIRLTELENQIREEAIDRAGWFRRSFGPGEIRDYLQWLAEGANEDEDQDQDRDQDRDQEDENQEEELTAVGPDGRQADPGRPGLQVRARLALPAGSGPPAVWAGASVPPVDGRSCGMCRGSNIRDALGRHPAAILRAEASDLQWMLWRFGQPMPELCGPHYAETAREYARDHVDGSRLFVSESFDRAAVQQMRAAAETVPMLVNGQLTYQPEWQ